MYLQNIGYSKGVDSRVSNFDVLCMKWENDTFGLVLRMRQMVYSSKDFESLVL